MSSNITNSTSAKPKRRWLRYSLRGLLVLVALVSIPLAWVANKVNALRPQLDAAQRIIERGGAVQYELAEPEWIARLVGQESFRQVSGVAFGNGSGVVRRELRKIEHMRNFYKQHLQEARQGGNQRGVDRIEEALAELPSGFENWESLYEKQFASDRHPRTVDNDDFADIRFLPNLRRLDANTAGITNESLVHLSSLSELESLCLSSTLIDGDGLRQLGSLRTVKKLFLRYLDLDDASLVHLRGFTELEWLYLRGNKSLRGKGLAYLDESQKLTVLQMSETGFDDGGMAELAKFPALETVHAGWTNVTDAGLEHLREMTNLRSLNVRETKVTDTGIQRLQAALPNLNVRR